MSSQLVSVQWTDSGMHVDHGWDTLDKYRQDLSPGSTRVQTVGILMHEDDEIMLIGLSYDPTHDKYYGAQMILKSNVLSIEPLILHTR
jgi:hypothetical protein